MHVYMTFYLYTYRVARFFASRLRGSFSELVKPFKAIPISMKPKETPQASRAKREAHLDPCNTLISKTLKIYQVYQGIAIPAWSVLQMSRTRDNVFAGTVHMMQFHQQLCDLHDFAAMQSTKCKHIWMISMRQEKHRKQYQQLRQLLRSFRGRTLGDMRWAVEHGIQLSIERRLQPALTPVEAPWEHEVSKPSCKNLCFALYNLYMIYMSVIVAAYLLRMGCKMMQVESMRVGPPGRNPEGCSLSVRRCKTKRWASSKSGNGFGALALTIQQIKDRHKQTRIVAFLPATQHQTMSIKYIPKMLKCSWLLSHSQKTVQYSIYYYIYMYIYTCNAYAYGTYVQYLQVWKHGISKYVRLRKYVSTYVSRNVGI